MMGEVGSFFFFVCLLLQVVFSFLFYQEVEGAQHDYGDALNKSILFFEGQRSGRLPANQRLTWRKDSALQDGHLEGVDLVGGYYDAGDNVKFGFPMAFSTTMLAWSVVEFGRLMGPQELGHAKAALKWGTEYLLKATRFPNRVFVQVGEPYADHNCWQRPEDMGTPRTIYSVDKHRPGSEVAAETAAALAAASIVFRSSDPDYSRCLLDRALKVFHFANTYRGSYSHSLGHSVCPFYCDFSGYMDELLWASTWIHKASGNRYYRNYTVVNKDSIDQCSEFGWDDKHAGINILISKQVLLGKDYNHPRLAFKLNADKFICSVLPESPTRSVTYSPGGLLFKPGGSNMQHPTALSFLLLVYARYLSHAQQVVNCGNVVATPARLKQIAKSQVDYILGSNPMKMSYMVGYGDKFPQRIHHRASSLPSLDEHPDPIGCKDGTPYFLTEKPNPNLLIGAVVGGPDITDVYPDSRSLFVESEPTTYINAPLLGLLAYFNANPTH